MALSLRPSLASLLLLVLVFAGFFYCGRIGVPATRESNRMVFPSMNNRSHRVAKKNGLRGQRMT
jgi:hypothetical protein